MINKIYRKAVDDFNDGKLFSFDLAFLLLKTAHRSKVDYNEISYCIEKIVANEYRYEYTEKVIELFRDHLKYTLNYNKF